MSRPRKVSDHELLQAAYDLIMDHGLHSLTFSNLGKRVGLVPAAIAKRFTTKKNLLAEVDDYALQRSTTALEQTMQRYNSPIDALIASMVTELSFASSLQRFVNGQSFLLYDLSNPELYENYRQSFIERRRQLVRLLTEARDAGLLTAQADAEELAELLQTIQHGTGHVWAMSKQGVALKDSIEHSIRLALRPYIAKPHV